MKEEFKNIKIKVGDKEISVFERFPDFIPFIGDKYGSGKHKKLLLIWESYYTNKSVPKIMKSTDKWYFEEQPEEVFKVLALFNEKTNDYERPWNFASKMHKDGRDRLFKWKTKVPNWTFQNVERILNEKTKEEDGNSFKYCAGYNYYLRPALKSSSIKQDKIDEDVAVETLKKIIDELKPDFVVFFSKKAHTSFKSHKKEFENVEFKAFVHPACAWWNTKSGKDKKSGKERFEEFIEQIEK
jgi:hypothetical protein